MLYLILINSEMESLCMWTTKMGCFFNIKNDLIWIDISSFFINLLLLILIIQLIIIYLKYVNLILEKLITNFDKI